MFISKIECVKFMLKYNINVFFMSSGVHESFIFFNKYFIFNIFTHKIDKCNLCI